MIRRDFKEGQEIASNLRESISRRWTISTEVILGQFPRIAMEAVIALFGYTLSPLGYSGKLRTTEVTLRRKDGTCSKIASKSGVCLKRHFVLFSIARTNSSSFK